MVKTIEEKQYDKDVKFSEKLKAVIFSFLTINSEPEKHRFKLQSQDGKIKYITFKEMNRLNAAEKRIKIYELSKDKAER